MLELEVQWVGPGMTCVRVRLLETNLIRKKGGKYQSNCCWNHLKNKSDNRDIRVNITMGAQSGQKLPIYWEPGGWKKGAIVNVTDNKRTQTITSSNSGLLVNIIVIIAMVSKNRINKHAIVHHHPAFLGYYFM